MSVDSNDVFNEYFTQAFNSVKVVKSTFSNQFHLTDRRNLGTVVGRPIVDESGRPFRVINGLIEVAVPDPTTKEIWRTRFMSPSNYVRYGVTLSKDTIDLINKVIEKASRLNAEDEELGKKYGERVIYRETKKFIIMFMKICKCTPSQISDRYSPPATDSITIVTTSTQAFLDEFENRWKIKCEVSGNSWVKSTFGRELGKTDRFMMIQTRKKLPTEGIGYKVTMEFTEGSPIEITEDDLKSAKDLNEAVVGPNIDIDRLSRINMMLDQEIELRKQVLNGMDSVEPPNPEVNISKDQVKSVPSPKATSDDDFGF